MRDMLPAQSGVEPMHRFHWLASWPRQRVPVGALPHPDRARGLSSASIRTMNMTKTTTHLLLTLALAGR